MKFTPLPPLFALLCGCFCLTSCITTGVNYERPSTRLPDSWTRSLTHDLDPRSSQLNHWWTGFNDPALTKLIALVRENNPDFKIAAQSVLEARAQRGAANSAFFPNASGSGSYSRNRSSENVGVPGGGTASSLYQTGFDTGWELDVFGGISRSVEAADAAYDASIEDYRDLLVTLFAETALSYIDYRAAQERIYVAGKNIKIQSDSVDLVRSRIDAGLANNVDLSQAKTNLEASRALVPQLRNQLTAAKNRIATLTGGYPGSVNAILLKPRSIPMPKSGFSSGLPADLLRARPDIRRAERNLAAQTARIGIAEADLYPRFSLFGNFSLQSLSSSDLLAASSGVYSFGPSFSWQIFNAGKIRNNILAEEAGTEKALLAYEKSVLLAVEEVETSMAAVANERDRLRSLGRAVDAASDAVDLVTENYKDGLVDFQRVIDSERTLFQQEDAEVSSRGTIAANYVKLYKALGGGSQVKVIPIDKPRTSARGGPFRLAETEAPDGAIVGED